MTNVLDTWTLLLSLLLKHNRRPATYSREELDRLFGKCNVYEKMIFAILLFSQDLAEMLKELPQTAEWIFPNQRGGRTNHLLLRRLKHIAEEAKVKDATMHKLRHAYAIRLAEAGCEVHFINEILGHHSVDFTRKQYARFSPQSASRAVLKVLEDEKNGTN